MSSIRLFLSRRRTVIAVAITALFGAVAPADAADPTSRKAAAAWCADRCDELVIDWNATAYQVIKADENYANPMSASRSLAMMHMAMHDAVNAAQPRYTIYAYTERDNVADPAVAAVTAAHDVLAALYPKQAVWLKAALDKSLVDAGSTAAAARGIALGRSVAAAVLGKRAADGSAANVPYQQGSKPGEYRFTQGFDFAASPQWRSVAPFTLKSVDQFRSAPPPALNSAQYAAAFNEVKTVGGKVSAKRTTDETHYSAFWYEFSDIGWNRVARVVARDQQQDLWQRARTFALVNAVMADAYIAGWDSKFHYNLWRPETAIRMADADGNAQTTPDASFAPLLVTPPVQDYPSTHSALGAAAAVVLAETFGRDDISFTFTSTSAIPANPERSFKSFSEAARENSDSRVKAGLHFRFATTAGLKLGEDIGRFAVRNSLTPLH
ncbi:MAG: phosphatase PAP2 family protein [Burkholderiaceae bacterium]